MRGDGGDENKSNVVQSWVDTIISLMPAIPELCSLLDTRYFHCKSRLYKLKLPIIFKKNNYRRYIEN